VDEDRVRGAMKAKDLGAEVIVLDDGYQHLRLKRDLNILLIDATSSPVIPFGRSREPASAARAADVVVNNDHKDGSDNNDGASKKVNAVVKSIASSLMSFTDVSVPLTELKGKRFLALSSIANPERFYTMLRELGATVVPKSLGDHAEYSDSLVRIILNHAETHGVEMIVTTMKDAVKSRKYFERTPTNIPILIILHSLEFLQGEDGFYQSIDRIL
jgi:tetraacyldisaccharide 4'-kinase